MRTVVSSLIGALTGALAALGAFVLYAQPFAWPYVAPHLLEAQTLNQKVLKLEKRISALEKAQKDKTKLQTLKKTKGPGDPELLIRLDHQMALLRLVQAQAVMDRGDAALGGRLAIEAAAFALETSGLSANQSALLQKTLAAFKSKDPMAPDHLQYAIRLLESPAITSEVKELPSP